MRSRTDAAVPLARERILRLVGIVALLVLGARLVLAPPRVHGAMKLTTEELATGLVRATRVQAPGIHLTATRALAPDERDWLRALKRAGSDVTWSPRQPIAPFAVQAEPVIAPGGRVSIAAFAPAAGPIALRDNVGLLDSLPVGPSGALTLEAYAEGPMHLHSVAGEASIEAQDAAMLRPVLVVGPAGWESKYVVAALEEAGWSVQERISVAPNVTVGSGSAVPLDTARIAAVVVLDSLSLRAADVARFVRSGGGAILALGAVSQPAFASLAGASPGERLRGELGALTASDPRRGLSALTFRVHDAQSTVLERRGGAVIAVARRVGAGRVLALGVEETWRWRMQGADGAVEAHRAWWSSAVAKVAYAPLPNAPPTGAGLDAAPVAATYAVLGPPAPGPPLSPRVPTSIIDTLLVMLALISLVAEWMSRRLRGAR